MTSVNEVRLYDEYSAAEEREILLEAGRQALEHGQVTIVLNHAGGQIFAIVPVETARSGLILEDPFNIQGLSGTRDSR